MGLRLLHFTPRFTTSETLSLQTPQSSGALPKPLPRSPLARQHEALFLELELLNVGAAEAIADITRRVLYEAQRNQCRRE